jgi:hypothetical protein
VRGDVTEVLYATAIVSNPEIIFIFLLATDNCDIPGARIDGILDKLGHCLERIILGEGDNADDVPVVAYFQFAGFSAICSGHIPNYI